MGGGSGSGNLCTRMITITMLIVIIFWRIVLEARFITHHLPSPFQSLLHPHVRLTTIKLHHYIIPLSHVLLCNPSSWIILWTWFNFYTVMDSFIFLNNSILCLCFRVCLFIFPVSSSLDLYHIRLASGRCLLEPLRNNICNASWTWRILHRIFYRGFLSNTQY